MAKNWFNEDGSIKKELIGQDWKPEPRIKKNVWGANDVWYVMLLPTSEQLDKAIRETASDQGISDAEAESGAHDIAESMSNAFFVLAKTKNAAERLAKRNNEEFYHHRQVVARSARFPKGWETFQGKLKYQLPVSIGEIKDVDRVVRAPVKRDWVYIY